MKNRRISLRNEGITLVALVVTIIVLLILARNEYYFSVTVKME